MIWRMLSIGAEKFQFFVIGKEKVVLLQPQINLIINN